MTKFETILRLAEIKGMMRMDPRVPNTFLGIIQDLIDDLSEEEEGSSDDDCQGCGYNCKSVCCKCGDRHE